MKVSATALLVSWYVFSIGDAPGARLFRLAISGAKRYATESGSVARPAVGRIDAENAGSVVSSSSTWVQRGTRSNCGRSGVRVAVVL
jgi:hypothetical protein